MKATKILAILVLVILAAGLALCQEDKVESTLPSPVLQGPGHLGGEAPQLATQSDLATHNVILGGITLGAAFDSKGLYHAPAVPGDTGYATSDTRFFAQPSLAFQQTLKNVAWTLSYTPGVSISEHNTSDYQYAHNVAGDLTWMPSHRVLIHLRQDYSLSTNPFETVGRVPLLPGLGGPLGPNYEGVLPETRRTSLVSNADITFRLGPHTSLGFTGGFQKYDYASLSTGGGTLPVNFINSQVVNASAFFSEQLSASQTIGVQAIYSDIYSYGAETARTQAPTVLLYDTWQVNPHTTLTLFAGPEYVRSRDVLPITFLGITIYIPFYEHSWEYMAGGTFTWMGRRNALDITGSRRISPGGGLMGTVAATYGGVAFRTRWTPRWTTELRVNFTDQTGADLLGSGMAFRTFWAGGSVVRDLGRHFAIRVDAAYVRQMGTGLGLIPGNHVLVQGSLDYHFEKGLGGTR